MIGRKGIAITLVLSLSFTMLMLVPVSHASTPGIDYYLYEYNAKCQQGYDGNSTIYMVKGINSTSVTGVNYTRAARIIGTENVSGYQTSNGSCDSNYYGTPNILYLTAGGANQSECYLNNRGYLGVNLSLAFMGAFKNSSRSDYYINNVELSVSASSGSWNSDNNILNLLYTCNSGFNTTGPIDLSSGTYLSSIVSLGLTGLGTVAKIADNPLVEILVAGASGAYTIYGAATGNSQSIVSQVIDGGSVYEYFGVTGGGPENPGSNSYFGDVFGAGVPVHLIIHPAQFNSPITYTISASSAMGKDWTNFGYCNVGSATHVMLTVKAVPAVEISGTVYLGPGNQHPDANNYVYLQEGACGQNYKVPTNSAGDFRFFGAPDTNYTIHATYSSPANGTGSYHPELSENSVTVSTGSPGGLVYAGLHVGGVVQGYVKDYAGQPISDASVYVQNSAGDTEKVLTNSEGFYYATVGNTSTYTVTAKADGVTDSNSVNLDYLETAYDNFTLAYVVTFSESGLPSGTEWSVDFNGNTQYSTSTSTSFSAWNGTYSYTIGSTTSSGDTYDPSLSSGSVTVSGSNQAVDVSFIPVSIVFDGSGLHGNTWSVTINSNTKSTSGSSISFPEPVDNYYYPSVGAPSGYSASESSSSVYLGTSSTTVDIQFTATSTYTVTFDETGLPAGHTWSVTMDGTTNSASTGSSIGFSGIPNGYFSYSPSSLLVPVAGETGYYYDYHASGGTAHVNGASQTIGITYSRTEVHYCVNASAEILLANGSYEQAQSIGTGTYIMTYNLTTGTLQKELVQQVLSVNETSMYTINGNLQVSGDQPVLTQQGWMAASYLHKGDMIFDPLSDSFVSITTIFHSQGTYTMYDFVVSGNNDYIAYTYLLQGVLT